MLLMVIVVLIGLSSCTTYRSPLIWKKSKMMESMENKDYEPLLKKRSQQSLGVHADTGVYETDDLEYVQDITIGTPEQRFTVWLRLESDEMYVPNHSCKTKWCERKRKFVPQNSKTYTNCTDEQRWRSRLDGIEAAGFYGDDSVKLGSQQLIIPSVRFGIAEKILYYRNVKTEFDGILGLSFSIHSADNGTSQTFIDRIVKKGVLDSPVFTIWLGERPLKAGIRAGQITYGAVDNTNCGPVVAEVPLQGFTSYEYEISGIKMGKVEYRRSYTAYHSMNTWISGPQEPVKKMASIAGAKLGTTGTYSIACNASFPDFIIYIGKKSLQIASDKLILKVTDDSCVFAMLPLNKEATWWEFGAPFHRQYCTVFDIGAKKLRFLTLLRGTASSTTTQSPENSVEGTLLYLTIASTIAFFNLF